jgi:hypothetical protein
MQLDRIKKNAKDYCHEFYENDLEIQGSYSIPAEVWGIIYVNGNVRIGGRIAGKGMIVCDGKIYITEDVLHDNGESFLSLVSFDTFILQDNNFRVNVIHIIFTFYE